MIPEEICKEIEREFLSYVETKKFNPSNKYIKRLFKGREGGSYVEYVISFKYNKTSYIIKNIRYIDRKYDSHMGSYGNPVHKGKLKLITKYNLTDFFEIPVYYNILKNKDIIIIQRKLVSTDCYSDDFFVQQYEEMKDKIHKVYEKNKTLDIFDIHSGNVGYDPKNKKLKLYDW